MRFLLLMLLLAPCTALARAADAPKKPEKIPPARVRILVDLDKATTDSIRAEIRREVEKALAERRRRLRWSRKELDAQLKKELARYKDELDAIRHAEESEWKAREAGDETEAARWARLKMERMRSALDLARRARLAEEALLGMSLAGWRARRERERQIADGALRRLEAAMRQIDAAREAEVRERGRGVVPPHE